MKNLFLVIAALILTVGVSHAQTTPNQAKVKVNIELNPFQTIEIGSGAGANGAITTGYGDELTLEYKSADDYKNGVEKNVLKQLKVTSVGSGYKILATLSDNAQFNKVNGSGDAKVDANQLLKIAVGNKSSMDAAASMDLGSFGTTSGAESSVFDQELDVKYTGKAITDVNLLKKVLNDKTQAKYSIDVVYTIAAN
ncbi:hypothetical protein [Sphingobacterium kyonggiense]